MLGLDQISGFKTAIPTACYVLAGAFLGRKVIQAAGCKMVGIVTALMGNQNSADWNIASHRYLAQAKKDAVRDLTAATCFIGLGLLASSLIKEEKSKEVEPGYFEGIDFKPLAITLGVVAFSCGYSAIEYRASLYNSVKSMTLSKFFLDLAGKNPKLLIKIMEGKYSHPSERNGY